MAGAKGSWFDRAVINGGRPMAWLTIVLMLFPQLMAVVSLAAYLLSSDSSSGGASLLWGVILGLVFSGIVGALSLSFLAPDQVNPYEFRELNNRVSELQNQLTRIGAKASDASSYAPDKATMFAEPGLRWIAGAGYLSLWTKVHQAEEALFMVEDVDWLVAEANRDLLRMKGSKFPQAEAFTADITAAVKALSPAATKLYLSSAPVGDPFAADPKKWENLARMKLQEVRAGINTYRQSLWDGIVRARNQFLRTLLATALVTSVVVDLAVGHGTDPRVVLTATMLYLTGTLVGLFARLQGLISSRSVEEDFGLDTTHLIAAPILSGVAAVIGVLLVSLLKLKIGDINIGAPSVGAGESTLRAVFNLGTNPGSLVIAALFGLTPELLIRYLKSQSDSFQNGLTTTETWGKSAANAIP